MRRMTTCVATLAAMVIAGGCSMATNPDAENGSAAPAVVSTSDALSPDASTPSPPLTPQASATPEPLALSGPEALVFEPKPEPFDLRNVDLDASYVLAWNEEKDPTTLTPDGRVALYRGEIWQADPSNDAWSARTDVDLPDLTPADLRGYLKRGWTCRVSRRTPEATSVVGEQPKEITTLTRRDISGVEHEIVLDGSVGLEEGVRWVSNCEAASPDWSHLFVRPRFGEARAAVVDLEAGTATELADVNPRTVGELLAVGRNGSVLTEVSSTLYAWGPDGSLAWVRPIAEGALPQLLYDLPPTELGLPEVAVMERSGDTYLLDGTTGENLPPALVGSSSSLGGAWPGGWFLGYNSLFFNRDGRMVPFDADPGGGYVHDGVALLVTHEGDRVVALDLAAGEELWSLDPEVPAANAGLASFAVSGGVLLHDADHLVLSETDYTGSRLVLVADS